MRGWLEVSASNIMYLKNVFCHLHILSAVGLIKPVLLQDSLLLPKYFLINFSYLVFGSNDLISCNTYLQTLIGFIYLHDNNKMKGPNKTPA